MRATLLLMLVALSMTGCARYEYDIVRPETAARHIGGRMDEELRIDPLEYRLRTVDNRLVMRVYNQTDEVITLQGAQSSAVDPEGQSHPLRTATMAPQSFIKLILPPLRPRVERVGPSIGIGVGGVFGRAGPHGYGFRDDYLHDEPQYLTVYEDDNALYWDWTDEGSVRLMLVYQRGQQTFTHEFVIRRRKKM